MRRKRCLILENKFERPTNSDSFENFEKFLPRSNQRVVSHPSRSERDKDGRPTEIYSAHIVVVTSGIGTGAAFAAGAFVFFSEAC